MFLKLLIAYTLIYSVQSDPCNHVLRELANAQMQFVQCVTVNSVPVTMCVGCAEKHKNVSQLYDVLSANCSDIYFDKDRINLIASTEFALTGLWSKAYCDDCFNNNNYLVFNEKYTEFTGCLNDNKEEPCENCKYQYLDLNNFYITLDQHNNGEVCYDLQDSMNRTRDQWSKEKNCCRREKNLTLFMITLFITLSLPLLFYGTTYCITRRQERRQRVIFNEDPYISDGPSSTRPHNITPNNLTQSMFDNLPSPSNADTTNTSAAAAVAANTSLTPKVINDINSAKDMESSDDELLTASTIPSKKDKIKNI